MKLSVVDWVNLICAALSLFATILIGAWQIRQSCRMDKLEQRQVDIEKKRYEESVEIDTRRFLSKYSDFIGLLPLCAVAFVYDENRAYSRDMYSEFRLLSKDVRLKIFERCGWFMCDVETDDFFGDCMKCLQRAFESFLPKDSFNSMFYERGKYIQRAILCYAKEDIPHSESEYENRLTDILVVPFRNDEWDNYDSSVIDKIKVEFGFGTCDEIEACQIACLVARYIGAYSGQHFDNGFFVDYGSPGGWSHEKIETMEDLFLVALFEIWSNLWALGEESEVERSVNN